MPYAIRRVEILTALANLICPVVNPLSIVHRIYSLMLRNQITFYETFDSSKTIKNGDMMEVYINVNQESQLEVDLILIQELTNVYNIDILNDITLEYTEALGHLKEHKLYNDKDKIHIAYNLVHRYAKNIELVELDGQILCICYVESLADKTGLTDGTREFHELIMNSSNEGLDPYYERLKIPRTAEKFKLMVQRGDVHDLNIYLKKMLKIYFVDDGHL